MGQGPGATRLNAKRKASGRESSERFFYWRARGLSNREIARKFNVSESTVSKGIAREYEKPIEGADDVRKLEAKKLDERERRWRLEMQKASDPEALERCDRSLHRVAERRAKLLGLDVPVVEKINLEVSAGVASPSKAREAMHSAFGMIGPEGNTIGPQPGNDSPSIGPDAAQREGPVGAGGKPSAP